MALHVKVHPKARRDSVQVIEGGSLKIDVTAPPEGGKANDAVIALLAKALGVAKSDVEIVRGAEVEGQAGPRARPDRR